MLTNVLVVFLFLFGSTVFADELLIFTANWCAPCKQFKEDYGANPTIVAPYTETAKLFDIKESADLAKKYKVTSVPAFLIVNDAGEIVRRQTGYDGPVRLKRWLEKRTRR